MKKGELKAKILEIISEAPMAAVDVIEAMLTSGYGASYGKLSAQVRAQQRRRTKRGLELKEKQKLYNLMSQLKKDGLIKEGPGSKKRKLIPTPAGKKKFRLLRQKIANQLPPQEYPQKKGNKLTILIFDIPEKQKKKRDWLRGALKELNFRMIQKSVWVGEIKIPAEFIKDLNMLRLINFIEIFEVSKIGSLKDKLRYPMH